jgi:hypothetical protein
MLYSYIASTGLPGLCASSCDAGTLRVEVRESTFYNVKVAELEA